MSFATPSYYRKMDGNLIDMRKKQSLILWVLLMSIIDFENKRKLHNEKNQPEKASLAYLFFEILQVLNYFQLKRAKIHF